MPLTGPVLTHGDLWSGNILAGTDGGPSFIDPSVSWMWPDVDLSMVAGTSEAPVADQFFGGYREVRPLDPGWRRRMPVLHLRELLSTIAHDGDRWGAVDRVRIQIAGQRTSTLIRHGACGAQMVSYPVSLV